MGVLLVSLIFLPFPLKFLRGGWVKGWPDPLVKVGATGSNKRAPTPQGFPIGSATLGCRKQSVVVR